LIDTSILGPLQGTDMVLP